MKLLSTVAICAGLIAGVSATAQDASKKEGRKDAHPVIVKDDDAAATLKNTNKNVKSVHLKDGEVIIIRKKDGTVERYRLSNTADLKKAEGLYGELPPPPPPPPALPSTPPPPPPVED